MFSTKSAAKTMFKAEIFTIMNFSTSENGTSFACVLQKDDSSQKRPAFSIANIM